MASLLGSVYGGGAEAGVPPNAGIETAGLRVGGEVGEVNVFVGFMLGVGSSADLLVGVLDNKLDSLRDLCWKKPLSSFEGGIFRDGVFEVVDAREWQREVSNIKGIMTDSAL